MPVSTNRDSDKFVLRLPSGMRDEIKAAADKNGRSMNAEIINRLQASLITGNMTPADFLGVMDMQHDNAHRIAEMLRKVADRVETLGSGAIEIMGDE